jgi:hypothetical protein
MRKQLLFTVPLAAAAVAGSLLTPQLVAASEEAAPGAASRWFRDADGDGFGDFYDFLDSAVQPSGYVADHTDCADDRSYVHPGSWIPDDVGATRVAPAFDDYDCDGTSGEDVRFTFRYDRDRDGYPSSSSKEVVSGSLSELQAHATREGVMLKADWLATPFDCNDYLSGVQNGCNNPTRPSGHPYGSGGDPTGGPARDSDGDGHIDRTMGGDDCNDGDATRHPGRPEARDAYGHDEDCDPLSGAPAIRDHRWLDPRFRQPWGAWGSQTMPFAAPTAIEPKR